MVVFMGSDPSWMISSADFNDRIWLFFPPHYGCTHNNCVSTTIKWTFGQFMPVFIIGELVPVFLGQSQE